MEQWKPVAGYEGLYEASSYGRVRSVECVVPSSFRNGGARSRPSKVLKPNRQRNGYLKVSLSKDGEVRTWLVHSLIAAAFCPRREADTQVNHKNLVKTDNRAENLEWCTAVENVRHAAAHGLYDEVRASRRKEIVCVELARVFESSYAAATWVNEHDKSFAGSVPVMARRIRGCCTGLTHSAYGYHWADVKSKPSTTIPKGSTPKRVEAHDPSK